MIYSSFLDSQHSVRPALTKLSTPTENTSPRRLAIKLSAIAALFSCLITVVPSSLALDSAREELKIDQAAEAFGYDGSGVIVAIFSNGIDWRHPDFRNADGTTRIKYIYDLGDNTGANAEGNSYGAGTIYTEAQINTALSDQTELATRDATGSGTPDAGLAAGNGLGFENNKYRGIAPNATIIIVKAYSNGAPEHDEQVAETAFFDQDSFLSSIDFVIEKADELNMPVVMALNFGGIGGPTDGTSKLARKIDSVVGPGKKGVAIVTLPGSQGGFNNRANATIQPGETVSLEISKPRPERMRFDMWYAVEQSGDPGLTVTIKSPDGETYGPLLAPTSESDQVYGEQADVFMHWHFGRDIDFYESTNDKREVLIDFVGEVGTYILEIHRPATGETAKEFDATVAYFVPFADDLAEFLTFGSDDSVSDFASARYAIKVSGYQIRTHWVDVDGIARGDLSGAAIGTRINLIGSGNTFDERPSVDFATPAQSIFAPYDSNSYWNTFRYNVLQEGDGLYGVSNQLTAGSSLTAGLIALMFQANPELDATEIREILKESSNATELTDETPNPYWGSGVLDGGAALLKTFLSGTATTSAILKLEGTDPRIKFNSVMGLKYRIEYTDDLEDPTWTTLVENIEGTGNEISQLDESLAEGDQRFYRVVASIQ